MKYLNFLLWGIIILFLHSPSLFAEVDLDSLWSQIPWPITKEYLSSLERLVDPAICTNGQFYTSERDQWMDCPGIFPELSFAKNVKWESSAICHYQLTEQKLKCRPSGNANWYNFFHPDYKLPELKVIASEENSLDVNSSEVHAIRNDEEQKRIDRMKESYETSLFKSDTRLGKKIIQEDIKMLKKGDISFLAWLKYWVNFFEFLIGTLLWIGIYHFLLQKSNLGEKYIWVTWVKVFFFLGIWFALLGLISSWLQSGWIDALWSFIASVIFYILFMILWFWVVLYRHSPGTVGKAIIISMNLWFISLVGLWMLSELIPWNISSAAGMMILPLMIGNLIFLVKHPIWREAKRVWSVWQHLWIFLLLHIFILKISLSFAWIYEEWRSYNSLIRSIAEWKYGQDILTYRLTEYLSSLTIMITISMAILGILGITLYTLRKQCYRDTAWNIL